MSNKQNDEFNENLQQNNQEIIDGISDRKDWARLPTGILNCVTCGEQKITAPILNFFDFDGSRIQCHDCQDNNRDVKEHLAYVGKDEDGEDQFIGTDKAWKEKEFWDDKHALATNNN